MTVTSERYNKIRSSIRDHFLTDLGLPLSEIPRDEWDPLLTENNPLGPTAIAGWAWPCWIDEPHRIVILVCYDRIEEVTQHLNDDDLDDYLRLLDYICDLHIAYWGIQEPWERHMRIMGEIEEKFPGSLGLMQTVHLEAAS